MRWPFLASFKNQSPASTTGGFSLIELMVSITIMVMVISIVTTNQESFNGAVLLRNQAYEIALAVREVQLNAVSAVGDEGEFRSVLGVHFDTSLTNSGRYVVFKDSPSGAQRNGFYDLGEEFNLQGNLDKRFVIREIRRVGAVSAQPPGGLSVVFVRPNFDARFFDVNGEVDASSVEIDIARRGDAGTGPGSVRTIEITPTGQISVMSIP